MFLRFKVLAGLFIRISKWVTAAGGSKCANWPIAELCLCWQLSKPVSAGCNKIALWPVPTQDSHKLRQSSGILMAVCSSSVQGCFKTFRHHPPPFLTPVSFLQSKFDNLCLLCILVWFLIKEGCARTMVIGSTLPLVIVGPQLLLVPPSGALSPLEKHKQP